MANDAQVNDIGTAFNVTVKKPDGTVADISSATIKKIILTGPSAVPKVNTASFITNGSDGRIKYVTIDGDLNEPGGWKIQGYFESPSGKWHTSVGKFKVKANLN